MDGSPARSTEDGQLRAATVVIQYTTVRTSRFLEYGQRPPCADSVGRAPAVRRQRGSCSRRARESLSPSGRWDLWRENFGL